MNQEGLFIVIKYCANPSAGSDRALPVLMMDNDDNPLEFDRSDSAQEFVDILNMNSYQGFHYEIKELGHRYLKVSQKNTKTTKK